MDIPIPGTSEVACVEPITGDVLEAWRAARGGPRWPVVVQSWGESVADVFERYEYGGATPAALIAEARDHIPVFAEVEDEGPSGAVDESFVEWFTPPQPHLALLPTPHSWEALAYLYFYEQQTVNAIAVLRSWHARFGAELVCHYGTMLQFLVERPPTTPAEALQLAREQVAFAPCTTLLPGLTTGDLAQLLLGRPTWFLHERP